MVDPADLQAIWLTLKLASVTTLLLLCIATPLAWWLATSHRWYKGVVSACVALPLVLPPTVLGFYLLILMGPQSVVGELTRALGVGTLPFTFAGLVVGSVLFSLPFAVQPIRNAFETVGKRPLEVVATLRADACNRFISVALPLARPGFITAIILAFAHTVGEFGVVLMLGGNIDGETRVLSVAIYSHVEAMEYGAAHWLAGGMLLFSFLVLLALYMAGGNLWLGQVRQLPGSRVRARVLARDVSIATQAPQGSSINNILPAHIVEIVDDGAGKAIVRLRVGESQALLSRITRRSCDHLCLKVGMDVFAQVKSVALMA